MYTNNSYQVRLAKSWTQLSDWTEDVKYIINQVKDGDESVERKDE